MKKILLIIATILLFASCTKNYNDASVMYFIKGLGEPYTVMYLNESGKTITENINPMGNSDTLWTYNFTEKQGDLVYLYVKYKDVDPAMSTFKVMIKVDDKMFKYADSYDKVQVANGDTSFVIRRSGTVPF